MVPPVRVGIIGSNWGRMHVGAFRAAGADVVAICGRDLAKTEALARHESIPLATTEVATLCEASDLVVIASADRAHAEHLRAAIERGRHVLCEKPLTHSLAEAESLLQLTRSRTDGAVHAVCFP